MLKVYFKILLFCLPAIAIVTVVGKKYSKGFIDYNYAKITGKGNSLIIGTSRSSQGLQPDTVIKGTKYAHPMLNFAMSSYDSPFSEDYFKAICAKISNETTNGLFVVEIDPYAFCSDGKAESKTLKNILLFNTNPNYEYLFKNINPFYKLIERNNTHFESSTQHTNGWLEITLPMDSANVKNRSNIKINIALENIKNYKISDERINYFKKTIHFLQQHGTVVLLRLPAHEKMIEMENKYFSKLFNQLEKLIKNEKLKYFDFSSSNKKYQYVDANHLYKKDALSFSTELNTIIKSLP